MSKLDTKNVARLAVILSRYSKLGFHQCAADAVALAKIGAQLHKLAEAKCNVGLTERQQAKRVSLDRKVLQILFGGQYAIVDAHTNACTSRITYEVRGDPRGYVLRFKFPGGESNNWGGDFGV